MSAPKLSLKIYACLALCALAEILAIWLLQNPVLASIITLIVTLLLAGLVYLVLKPLSNLEQQLQTLHSTNYRQTLPNQNGDLTPLNLSINQILILLQNSSLHLTQDQQLIAADKTRFEAIINAVDDGVIALDHEYKLILLNQTAEKLTGYRTAQLLNQPLETYVTFQDNDGIKTHLDQLCKPHDGPDLSDLKTLQLVGRDKTPKPVKVSCSQIASNIPTNLKCILIIHDVSKEAALQGIQIDFVSMASHELRTPLTSIIGYLSVFIDENKAKLSKDQMEFLDRIMISAKQLGSLIENLLNVSKVERNAFSVNTQPVDWVKTLTKAVDDGKLAASQKHITLSLDPLPAGLPQVAADQIRILEVINNLISNAINYTPQGGTIQVGAKFDQKEVTTYVKDSGVGISKEALSHLFTKFFRVQGALDKSSNSKGTGLGLYLSKSIVDLHHGKIWVESEIGHGSTFLFTLPIATAQALPAGLTLPSQNVMLK